MIFGLRDRRLTTWPLRQLTNQGKHPIFAPFSMEKIKKKHGSGGIRTHASEETGALNQRLRPLGHATLMCGLRHNRVNSEERFLMSWCRDLGKASQSLWRNRLARSTVNRKVGGSSPPRDADFFLYISRFHSSSYTTQKNDKKTRRKKDEPDVIRTRNLLIWSQTRYRCATGP